MKVKNVLVSQPEPSIENSPYFDLQKTHNLKIDFRPFIHVEGEEAKQIRLQRIDLSKFTAIILTSRNAADHFFRVAEEMRYRIPDALKYFCLSEAVGYYLQKYVVYRKRKIYIGKRTLKDLAPQLIKFKGERFLLPASDKLAPDVPETLNKTGINWTKGVFYRTVLSDLSDLTNVSYDILVFFSPSGIDSLFKNFPKFKQKNTKIAVFGSTTRKAVEDKGLKVDLYAPSPETPSMSMALDKYISELNKK